ncbi:MAG TPA: pyridoxamine 5'-phosphate oxidase family protein [Steroidobacteraceae bacterium]|nr:pyridoxamine 5'-phosphate oxidase family protein [Steroidobacteraceae bacterium]
MADMDHQPQQPLSGARAIETVREIVTDANICLLVTRHDRFPFDARPMAAQAMEADGSVWFLSSSDSDKNRDIERDPRVTLLVQNNRKYEYAQLSGRATIHRDRALIDKYWTRLAEAWFDGKDDPRITLLAVHPETGHYWTTTNGKIAAGIKMLLSAAGADVDDGGVHGELRI